MGRIWEEGLNRSVIQVGPGVQAGAKKDGVCMNDKALKQAVRQFWNKSPCGTKGVEYSKFTREYFDKIEERRYRSEPEVHSFAQFTRFSGKRVLEVGVGAGTDFVQWVRAGAKALAEIIRVTRVDGAVKIMLAKGERTCRGSYSGSQERHGL